MRGARTGSSKTAAPSSAAGGHVPREDAVPGTSVSRAHLRDLAALLSLPRMWRGLDPPAIASGLLDVLVSLLRLDAAYVRLVDDTEFEDGRPRQPLPPASLGVALQAAMPPETAGSTVANPLGTGTMRLMRLAPPPDEVKTTVVLGSTRADFPTEFESFLCRVAVDQAMLAMHTSRLVEGLRAANSAKSSFLATMSHELRTPLNAVIGYAGLLQAEIAGTLHPQQKQHVTRIEAAARHLIDIIEGILSFARLEAGRERVNAADFRVSDLVEDVAALIEPLARAKSLSVDVTLEDPELVMISDSAKVRQILLNLLSNALKFTQKGNVTLAVRADGTDVLWSVRDTGVGIQAKNLERIFEPFRQVVESHADRTPGTGLGLSVSRHLARLLGGDVTVESTVGEGSVFTVRLPVRVAETGH